MVVGLHRLRIGECRIAQDIEYADYRVSSDSVLYCFPYPNIPHHSLTPSTETVFLRTVWPRMTSSWYGLINIQLSPVTRYTFSHVRSLTCNTRVNKCLISLLIPCSWPFYKDYVHFTNVHDHFTRWSNVVFHMAYIQSSLVGCMTILPVLLHLQLLCHVTLMCSNVLLTPYETIPDGVGVPQEHPYNTPSHNNRGILFKWVYVIFGNILC